MLIWQIEETCHFGLIDLAASQNETFCWHRDCVAIEVLIDAGNPTFVRYWFDGFLTPVQLPNFLQSGRQKFDTIFGRKYVEF